MEFSKSPLDRIIWSADLPDLDAMTVCLAQMVTTGFPVVKVDRLFLTANGLGVLDVLRDMGIRVFADAKIIEIPNKLVGIAELHLRHLPWMLNCMGGRRLYRGTDQ